MIIALAGRRIDASDAEPARFPAENVDLVSARIETEFRNHHSTTLVSAAACGADLIALEVAGKLGLRRVVVLPFSAEEFKQTSVVDRPGDWGEMYDRVIKESEIVLLGFSQEDDEVYPRTNTAIIETALSHGPTSAFVVWDGRSRGDSDVTAHFLSEARQRHLPVVEITTL